MFLNALCNFCGCQRNKVVFSESLMIKFALDVWETVWYESISEHDDIIGLCHRFLLQSVLLDVCQSWVETRVGLDIVTILNKIEDWMLDLVLTQVEIRAKLKVFKWASRVRIILESNSIPFYTWTLGFDLDWDNFSMSEPLCQSQQNGGNWLEAWPIDVTWWRVAHTIQWYFRILN